MLNPHREEIPIRVDLSEDLIKLLHYYNNKTTFDRFIGVSLSPNTLHLITNNWETKEISFDKFKPCNGIIPDFSDPIVIDHGHAIKLGEYEAAADAIIEDLEIFKGVVTKEKWATGSKSEQDAHFITINEQKLIIRKVGQFTTPELDPYVNQEIACTGTIYKNSFILKEIKKVN